MRRITTDINIRVVKNFAERSLKLEVVVDGGAIKNSRTYCYDRNRQEWFYYAEMGERIYVSDMRVADYLANFYKWDAKVLDMISDNMAAIADN